MKLILFDDTPGGDTFVQVAEVDSFVVEKDCPEMGFFSPNKIKFLFYGDLCWMRKHSLHRKRNIMKYITKLFRRKKRGNTDAG